MAHIMSDSGSTCSEEMKENFVENSRSDIVSLGERVVTKILDDQMNSEELIREYCKVCYIVFSLACYHVEHENILTCLFSPGAH